MANREAEEKIMYFLLIGLIICALLVLIIVIDLLVNDGKIAEQVGYIFQYYFRD